MWTEKREGCFDEENEAYYNSLIERSKGALESQKCIYRCLQKLLSTNSEISVYAEGLSDAFDLELVCQFIKPDIINFDVEKANEDQEMHFFQLRSSARNSLRSPMRTYSCTR